MRAAFSQFGELISLKTKRDDGSLMQELVAAAGNRYVYYEDIVSLFSF